MYIQHIHMERTTVSSRTSPLQQKPRVRRFFIGILRKNKVKRLWRRQQAVRFHSELEQCGLQCDASEIAHTHTRTWGEGALRFD